MKLPISITVAAILVLLSSHAVAGMRCGTKLVSIGDHFNRVEEICGQADATYPMSDKVYYRKIFNGFEEVGVAEQVRVDMWVYHLGENSFRRNLYFENGILVKVELGKRG